MAKAAPEPQAADEALDEAVRRLLKAQEEPRSLRWLARELGREVSFISRAIRGVDGKLASSALLAEIAGALGVEPEWFAAVREARVIAAIRADSQLRERLFNDLLSDGRR